MRGLREMLTNQAFTVTVEVDPPRGADPDRLLADVAGLAGRVEAVNVADSPMARLRMAPIAAAYLVQRELGVPAVFHLTCRDRNLLGLQAELLGASALGVKAILCLTGDPPSRGNHPTAKAVFDLDVLGLVRLTAGLNHGMDYMDNDLEGRTDLGIGVAANPCAPDLDVEFSKLRAKVEAGAQFVQTQPIFDLERLHRFHEGATRFGLPILYGVMPLKGYKSAVYMKEKVGLVIPDRVIRALERGGRAAAVEEAITTALAIQGLGAAGVHLFPLGDLTLLDAVLTALGRPQDTGVGQGDRSEAAG
ncbi:MAG: methylenetetrahydrofolate reductase [Firmicutes bacterium]|nr:methylenetetrahydrofolate reductase [Bacillota bacterium]